MVAVAVVLRQLPSTATSTLPTDTLGPEEVTRSGEFARLADRNRFVAGRQLIRVLVAEYTGVDPGAVELATSDGRVVVVDRPDLGASVSHSGEWVAAAIADGPVGVDVECRVAEPPTPTLVRRTCTAGEADQLAAAPDPRATFTRLWVRKEAVAKATGEGLAIGFDRLDVTTDLVLVPSQATRWSVRDLAIDADHHAAVAAEGTGWRVDVSRWGDDRSS